jgi:hypothetical protein
MLSGGSLHSMERTSMLLTNTTRLRVQCGPLHSFFLNGGFFLGVPRKKNSTVELSQIIAARSVKRIYQAT